MASLQQRSGSYRVIFRHRGQQHFVTIGRVSRQEAEAKAAQVEYLLLRLKQHLIELPAGVDIVDFVQFDGKPPAPDAAPAQRQLTLVAFRNRYLETHRQSLEERTIDTT